MIVSIMVDHGHLHDGLKHLTQQRLYEVAQAHGLTCFGPPAYGWRGKSIGSAAAQGSQTVWVKLSLDNEDTDGETDFKLARVPGKPELLNSFRDTCAANAERLIVMAFAPDPVAGGMPWTIREPDLTTTAYLDRLRETLLHLGHIEPSASTHALILPNGGFGRCGAFHSQWKTASGQTIHGDLHWSNLTAPDLCVLDWEQWGTGLALQDHAFLLAFSGLYPPVQHRIAACCPAVMTTRQGQLSRLFATAELLRMTEVHGDHPELRPSLLKLGMGAKQQWKQP